jgi:hypothetical protein
MGIYKMHVFDCRFNVVHFTRVTNEIILLSAQDLILLGTNPGRINELSTPLYE